MLHTSWMIGSQAEWASPAEQSILEQLAVGVSASEIAACFSSSSGNGSSCSTDDVRRAAARAADLLGEVRLRPPAAAGFLETRPFAADKLAELPERGADTLAAFASDPTREKIAERPARDADERVAVECAVAPEEDRRRIDDLLLWASMNGPIKTLEHWLRSYERLIEWLERDSNAVLFEEDEDKLAVRDQLALALTLLRPRDGRCCSTECDRWTSASSRGRPVSRRLFACRRHGSLVAGGGSAFRPPLAKTSKNAWRAWRPESCNPAALVVAAGVAET